MPNYRSIFCPTALLPSGWTSDALLQVDESGTIAEIHSGAARDNADFVATGPVLPGVPNAHSHAFQRAMAGLAERHERGKDNFWSWRDTMYQFVQRLTPADVQTIATGLYLELLRHGYTSVCEFHYLHHDEHGDRYEPLVEMSLRHLAAARATGIGITLLPVLYTYGGFDGRDLAGGQRRFFGDVSANLEMHELLRKQLSAVPNSRLGFAAHSLRATMVSQLREIIAELTRIDPNIPLHMHIAEQTAEVAGCVERFGQRPIEYLAAELPLDPQWCMIHATHLVDEETRLLAESQAVVGLCPTTEANLGDGIFPAKQFTALGGQFAIGSDSHVSVSPWEELRLLEYGQRLVHQQRNVLAVEPSSTGRSLFEAAVSGGALASGRRIGQLAAGCRADMLVIDDSQPVLAGRGEDLLLDALVFCGDASCIRDVIVGGRHVIDNHHHEAEKEITAGYRETVQGIVQQLE